MEKAFIYFCICVTTYLCPPLALLLLFLMEN